MFVSVFRVFQNKTTMVNRSSQKMPLQDEKFMPHALTDANYSIVDELTPQLT